MRTIEKIILHTTTEFDQVFSLPGWLGVAFISVDTQFANLIEVYCHIDTDKPRYEARFVVTLNGQPAPTNDYLYAGGVKLGTVVWHVWRNAVSQKLEM